MSLRLWQSRCAICSFSSDIWQLTFRCSPFYLDAAAHCYLFQLGWAKRCIGWVLQAKTDLQNIMRVPQCLVPLQKKKEKYFYSSCQGIEALPWAVVWIYADHSVIRIPKVSPFHCSSFTPFKLNEGAVPLSLIGWPLQTTATCLSSEKTVRGRKELRHNWDAV